MSLRRVALGVVAAGCLSACGADHREEAAVTGQAPAIAASAPDETQAQLPAATSPNPRPLPKLSPDAPANVLLARELACQEEPRATPALLRMIEEGLIKPKADGGADRTQCFYLRKPMRLPKNGEGAALNVKAVCADTADPEEARRHPDLYTVDFPGCCGMSVLSIYTDNAKADIEAWLIAANRLPSQSHPWAESVLSYEPAKPWTEVACRSSEYSGVFERFW